MKRHTASAPPDLISGSAERKVPASDKAWRRPLLQFVAAALVALVVLLLLTRWLGQRVATEEGIADAKRATALLARSAVEPGMPPGLVTGESAAVDRFDRLVRHRVLNGWLVRVKIWDASGRIVYSDEARIIGQRFELAADEREILRGGGQAAELSDLSGPENRYERSNVSLLEVYQRVRSPEGTPLLFEAYYRYSDVAQRGSEVAAGFRPIVIGSLLLFEALTIPLVWGLATRLRRAQRERERLLRRAIESSDRERRRIARDLHDGVVQELAGASFTLAAAADGMARQPGAATLGRVAAGLRGSIRSLRSLLVEIYPPDLHNVGLDAALADLLARLPGSGLETSLDVADGLQLSADDTELVWRVAQEVVRNALSHAHARRLDVRLWREAGTAVLEISDDGDGFDTTAASLEGHVGLRLLRDLARDKGGQLRVSSVPGAGTTVRLEVPER